MEVGILYVLAEGVWMGADILEHILAEIKFVCIISPDNFNPSSTVPENDHTGQ